MFLYLFCVSFAIEYLVIHFYSVLGKREPLPRYIVEQDVKPPIFGSYNYDPLTQLFEPNVAQNETVPSQIYNSSYILSTALGGDIVDYKNGTTKQMAYNKSNIFFRKHVTVAKIKTTQWWARSKPTHKNFTKYRRFK